MASPIGPTMPKSWQWLLRITGLVAMLLFLTPTAYVVKYYAVDLPRERKITLPNSPNQLFAMTDLTADDLPALEKIIRGGQDCDWEEQQAAITAAENVLLQPEVVWERPLECLSVKATLANAATTDPSPNVREAASNALQKIAQRGAVIQR